MDRNAMRTEMKVLIAFAALALAMAVGGDAAAAADASMQKARPSHIAHVSADHRNHAGGRPYSSYYLGRPSYYSPGPLFPWLPFIPDWRDPSGW
ncbi:hypothetical protein [Bradyrhizobium sp.]|jgi:hypothetical protein|uniref:hypothetical protein n=1 Tax=Bradyrhizobium sp. TaxID=376 RepID=UPI002C9FB845|nr:hypothetical protein [Bradyrhizobium sp.]HWX60424.1 hypothetical protein [Bradyrhizobium sp.]